MEDEDEDCRCANDAVVGLVVGGGPLLEETPEYGGVWLFSCTAVVIGVLAVVVEGGDCAVRGFAVTARGRDTGEVASGLLGGVGVGVGVGVVSEDEEA